MEHKVAMVLKREYGDRLIALTTDRHVWVVESPVNRRAVECVWSVGHDNGDLMGPGATIFDAYGDEDGEGAHDLPWTEILVVGASLTPNLKAAFEDLGGAVLFVPTEEGFVCRRAIYTRED